jgi:hypothetical protein
MAAEIQEEKKVKHRSWMFVHMDNAKPHIQIKFNHNGRIAPQTHRISAF